MQSTWRTAKHTKHGIALTSSKVLSPDRSGLLGKKEVLTNSSSVQRIIFNFIKFSWTMYPFLLPTLEKNILKNAKN